MKARVLSVLIALFLLAGAGALLAAPQSQGSVESSVGPNLINNSSFEGTYSAYDPPYDTDDCPSGVCGSAQMAPGWTPYWRPGYESQTDTIVMPEYKPADPIFTDPVRVRSGSAAQAYFTFWTTHEGGFYQQISVTSGRAYCLSIWGHSWSAEDDPGPHGDAYSGPIYGNFRQRVGIDPTGGTNWQSEDILWGATRVQSDFYEPFVVTATAQTNTITIYAYSHPEWAVKHNDAYWDDAYLGEVEPVLPEGDLTLTVTPDTPLVRTVTVNPNWLCDPGTSWEVIVEPDGPFAPSVSTTSGATGEELVVTFGAVGLSRGVYEATLQFSSPDTEESLPAIPVTIDVQMDLVHLFLPSLTGGFDVPGSEP